MTARRGHAGAAEGGSQGDGRASGGPQGGGGFLMAGTVDTEGNHSTAARIVNAAKHALGTSPAGLLSRADHHAGTTGRGPRLAALVSRDHQHSRQTGSNGGISGRFGLTRNVDGQTIAAGVAQDGGILAVVDPVVRVRVRLQMPGGFRQRGDKGARDGGPVGGLGHKVAGLIVAEGGAPGELSNGG